jgi:hypothetical protein
MKGSATALSLESDTLWVLEASKEFILSSGVTTVAGATNMLLLASDTNLQINFIAIPFRKSPTTVWGGENGSMLP